jgi:hypothetical protein
MNDAVLLVVLTVLATLIAERVIKRTIVHLAVFGFMRWLSRRAEEAERNQTAEQKIWFDNLDKALFWRAAWKRSAQEHAALLMCDDAALPGWRRRMQHVVKAALRCDAVSKGSPRTKPTSPG